MPSDQTDAIRLLPQPRQMKRNPGFFKSLNSQPDLSFDPRLANAEAYRLTITPTQIAIVAGSPAGAFYAEQTLAQLEQQFPNAIPCVAIEDWPDFPVRGVMLDISRDKVPTMVTLFRLVDMLASWKINQLQLYIEHTFAYSKHCTVWEHASPMTGEEIRELDQYCRDRFIELVPNQNSFGHMERWLNHPEYQHLAEAIDGADTGWGFRWVGPFSLCPTDPGSLDLLKGLYSELLPNFSSGLFNVGCDETFDIGQGRSKDEADRIGKHRVYLNFIRQVNDLVRANGRRMMFWGDMIIHRPELIAQLPRDVIALQWGYEDNLLFDEQCEKFAEAGVPFYICPGTSSWNSVAGRTQNALTNLRRAAEAALRHGAIGYLNTDWGDHGHLQYLPVSYLGFAAGAAFSWCLQSNIDLDFADAISRHAMDDNTGTLGRVAYDLGNVYQACGKPNNNGSTLFRLMVPAPSDPNPEKGLTAENLEASDAAIDLAMAPLNSFVPQTVEARLIVDEFRNAAAILHHCVTIGRIKIGSAAAVSTDLPSIISEHRRLWLARNRAGGLNDSANRLQSAT